MEQQTAIKLGSKVRDKISGFTGIATGRAEYLYTTSTVQVTPDALDSNNKRLAGEWIEEAQLELVAANERLVGYRALREA